MTLLVTTQALNKEDERFAGHRIEADSVDITPSLLFTYKENVNYWHVPLDPNHPVMISIRQKESA